MWDRREAVRLPCTTPVTAHVRSRTVRGQLAEVGPTGFRVLGRNGISAGTKVTVRVGFPIYAGAEGLRGIVVWCSNKDTAWEIGVQHREPTGRLRESWMGQVLEYAGFNERIATGPEGPSESKRVVQFSLRPPRETF